MASIKICKKFWLTTSSISLTENEKKLMELVYEYGEVTFKQHKYAWSGISEKGCEELEKIKEKLVLEICSFLQPDVL